MPEFWNLDPASGRISLQGRGEPYEIDLTSRTNGRYDMVGGQIVDLLAGGRPVADIDPLLRHTLSVDDEGNYWLSTEVPTQAVNTPQTEHVQWVGFLSGSITSPSGKVIPIDREQTWVTAFDRQLWVRDVENPGRGDWMQVQYDLATGNPIERVPQSFRLATAEEALEYAAVGWLVSRQSQLLNEIVASGQVDNEGNPIETVSDAALWLTSNLTSQAVRFQFLPRGEPQ